MHRFYAPSIPQPGGTAVLDAQEAAHIRVLRLCPGDEMELLDGRSVRCLAVLTQIGREEARAQVLRVLPGNETRARVTLYQGMPKSDKMEWIVQKSTELGACAVRGIWFARSDVRLVKDGAERKLDRLEKIAMEAAKQCGRCAPARVLPPQPFGKCDFSAHSAVFVAWEEGGAPFVRAVAGADLSDAALVIGPEGGITREEIESLQRQGAVPVTLGRRILRTETAAVAALSALMCLAGEWDL